MSINLDSSSTQSIQFSFQHFDQEYDFGVISKDGSCVRKKKRPGRKPNPPSTEKRKAQNRNSQRAYRQRETERKQEFEKERCQYLDEIRALKKKLVQTEYEAKYLKATVLHLTLSFLAERGTVPHSWANEETVSDLMGIQPTTNEENIESNPPLLKVVLKNERIVDLSQAMCNTFQADSSVHCIKYPPEDKKNLSCFTETRFIPMHNGPQQFEHSFSTPSGKTLSPKIVECNLTGNEKKYTLLKHLPQNEDIQINNIQLTMRKNSFRHVLFQPPSLQTADDLIKMPPLQAVHVSRLQLKISSLMGPNTMSVLEPTALQKIIPHDIRIDYIPGQSIRDRMILFQDYYDLDECFDHLTQNVIFTGGDIRIVNNWSVINPEFSSKFWFISHEFIDQSKMYHLMKPTDDETTADDLPKNTK